LGEQVGGGSGLPERRARRSLNVLKIAALVLASAAGALAASASATTPDTLVSNSAWWEKVTVTLDGNGDPESCLYQTSLKASTESCDVGSNPASKVTKASASKGEVTRITFERRFNPGTAPAKPDLQVGDTLLGGQMLALAIDAHGAVKGCRIVAASGSMRPDYGCDDAQAEKFQASAATGAAADREGFMTIIVYGHSEHMV
jgi:hypothetical protein